MDWMDGFMMAGIGWERVCRLPKGVEKRANYTGNRGIAVAAA